MKKNNLSVKKNVRKISTSRNLEIHSEKFVQYYGIDVPALLAKYLKKTKFNTIMDCGCGDGILLDALIRNKYLLNKKIIAVDLSRKRIENIRKLNKSINAFIDSAEDLVTIKDKSIDFFISTQVIEHVDDKKMLNSIDRVLKKDGTAYVTTVFKKWYGWYFYRRSGKWVLDVTHLREYKKDEELLGLIDSKKFKILETNKQQIWFPIMDFALRRMSINNTNFFNNNSLLRQIRRISIPILGYYDWEIVFKKR